MTLAAQGLGSYKAGPSLCSPWGIRGGACVTGSEPIVSLDCQGWQTAPSELVPPTWPHCKGNKTFLTKFPFIS